MIITIIMIMTTELKIIIPRVKNKNNNN